MPLGYTATRDVSDGTLLRGGQRRERLYQGSHRAPPGTKLRSVTLQTPVVCLASAAFCISGGSRAESITAGLKLVIASKHTSFLTLPSFFYRILFRFLEVL